MRRKLAITGVITAAALLLSAIVNHTVAAHGTADATQPRLVVFEMFGRQTCLICKAAAPIIDDMATSYEDKSVIFLEHDVDHTTGGRQWRWWTARGSGGSAQTPLIMVDSGHQWGGGQQDFRQVYTDWIEAERKRPLQATLTASFQRTGDTLAIQATVTNLLDVPLGYDNSATLTALVYEDSKVIHTGRFVRAGATQTIDDDILPGDSHTVEFALTPDANAKTNWSKSHVVVLLDYQPNGAGAFDLLQSALAGEGMPTPPPTATDEPTATPVPPTAIPTDVPPTAEVAPEHGPLYLPSLWK